MKKFILVWVFVLTPFLAHADSLIDNFYYKPNIAWSFEYEGKQYSETLPSLTEKFNTGLHDELIEFAKAYGRNTKRAAFNASNYTLQTWALNELKDRDFELWFYFTDYATVNRLYQNPEALVVSAR